MGRRFLLILLFLLLSPPAQPLLRAQDERDGPPAPDAAPAAPSDLPPPRPLDLPASDEGLPPIERPKAEPDGTPARKDQDRKKAPDKKKASPPARARTRIGGAAKEDDRPAAPSSDVPDLNGLSPVPTFEEATGDTGNRPGGDPPRSAADGAPPVETPKTGRRKGHPAAQVVPPHGGRDANPPSPPASGSSPGLRLSSPATSVEQVPPAGAPPRAGRPSRPTDDPDVTRTDGPAATAGESGMAGPPVDQLPAGKQVVAVTIDVRSPPNMNLHQKADVRIIVHNTGASDALKVRIRDELPEGLKFVSSEPAPASVERDSVLTWTLPALAAGKDQVIKLRVEPVKTGDLDHGVSVWFQTGSKARTKVYQPRLKIEQLASSDKVLRGEAVEFKIRVTNVGDGPARNVTVMAKLSAGLRYGSGGRGTDEMITEPIPVLAPEQSEDLDPLVAAALLAGEASCTVRATSPDVIPQDKDEEAQSVSKVTVVEPRLEVAITGPKRRCTDTNATYEIAVNNPGTAPARKVRVVAFVPPGARLLTEPKGARYDSPSRRIQWSIDALDPDSPRKYKFEVKVGRVGKYDFTAEAAGGGGLKDRKNIVTDVFGMADVDLVVSEQQRVVDVKGKTFFLIRLHNYGTKEATNILLSATVSKNLEVTGSFDVPPGLAFGRGEGDKDGPFLLRDAGGRSGIKKLGPGEKLEMGLEVEATAAEPKVATCRVQVTHDGLSVPLEDMAHVQVLNPSSEPADPGGR
jgi:uncharacterized repeat protein (TIGR01451 family)